MTFCPLVLFVLRKTGRKKRNSAQDTPTSSFGLSYSIRRTLPAGYFPAKRLLAVLLISPSHPISAMPYKTYQEQVESHIAFLVSLELDVHELQIDQHRHNGWVRVHPSGKTKGRGELVYKCTSSQMSNGLVGLGTICRTRGGEFLSHRTYGRGADDQSNGLVRESCHVAPRAISEGRGGRSDPEDADGEWDRPTHEEARKRAYGFWSHCSRTGTSPYLLRKGVGSYGIRFRTSQEWGVAAIVPMLDSALQLWSYQILNEDGSKRFPKDARTKGLFHPLQALLNGAPIGIAESYVTAASCCETTTVLMVCAFSCDNLEAVALALRGLYPDSPLLVFADNDRHLPRNEGVIKAREACDAVGCNIRLLIPDFAQRPPSKNATDWNDLVRFRGSVEAFLQYTSQAGELASTENAQS